MTPFQRKRLAIGLTQYALAKKLGAVPSTVSKWENGQATPAAEFYPRLAKIFGMTPEDVTHLFDESPAPSVAPTAETSAA